MQPGRRARRARTYDRSRAGRRQKVALQRLFSPPTGRRRRARARRAGGGRRAGRRGVRLLAGRRRLGRRGRRAQAVPEGEDVRGRPDAALGPPAHRHGAGRRPERGAPLPGTALVRLRHDDGAAVARPPVVPTGRLRDHPPRPRPARRRAGGQGRGHLVAGSGGGRAGAPSSRARNAHGCRRARSGPAGLHRRRRGRPVAAQDAHHSGALCGGGRRRQLPLRPDARNDQGSRASPRHGAARLLPLPATRRRLHRVAPRRARPVGRGGAGVRMDLPPGRRPGERRWAYSPPRGTTAGSTPAIS